MATAGGLPRNPPGIRRLRYQNGTHRGLEHKSWRGQGSAVPSLHPEGVGCNQPLLAHSLLQRVLLDEAKGDCTHSLDFEFKGSIKQRKSNLGASGRFAPLRPEGNGPFHSQFASPWPQGLRRVVTAWITIRFANAESTTHANVREIGQCTDV